MIKITFFIYKEYIRVVKFNKKNSDKKDRIYCEFCCKRVLNDKFDRHISSCFKIAKEGSILKMPEEGEVMTFRNYKNTLERPFIVYVDTEQQMLN